MTANLKMMPLIMSKIPKLPWTKTVIKNLRTFITVISAVATAFGLSGCGAYDPRQEALEPYVETNPSPQAIAGLWHHRHPSKSFTGTLLFRENGTGLYKPKGMEVISFMYEYAGNGVWRRLSQDGLRHIFKIANGKLLMYMPLGNAAVVFERQPSETNAAPGANATSASSSEASL